MASFFPTSVDNFANPVYTKVDGIDVVQAAHVNDIQDALRAVQETLITGKTIDYNSNNFIADNTSIKLCIETLDDNLGAVSQDFDDHRSFVLVTDPAQHHANVIEVTPIGNLSQDRVQLALEELQSDIDEIMSGGSVEGVTLDDRYVGKSGAQVMQGPLTINGTLFVEGGVTLGDAISDDHLINGDVNITGVLEVDGNIIANASVLMQNGQKIAEEGAVNAQYVLFQSDRMEFASHRDFIFKLDADDATDGNSDAGVFSIVNGLGATVFSVDEDGNISFTGSISGDTSIVATSLVVGDELEVLEDGLEVKADILHIQLDKLNTSAAARFLVTMDGDTGANLASADLLLNINENATMVTGIHVLKSGIQETGYLGLQDHSPNAGGVFFGQGVNFKTEMTNVPSSITLTIDENINAQNISVTHINKYGFFWECDSVAVGSIKVRGTYETLGN